MVQFEHVVKRFGRLTVLEDLNFTVSPGEFVTLIGPSGSGKTTILRLLMTLEKVTDGIIYIDGEPLSHMRKGDKLVPASEKHLRLVGKKIGMVFQHSNLFANMKVLRNITEAPIRSLGKSRDEAEQRATDLLEMVGLRDKVDAHPSQLSDGQQQRVAIARALAMEPKVLLLDTFALDPELVTGVLQLLKEIAQTTDITFLVATHEMQFARDASDRVIMFDQGHILEDAHPEKIFTNPDHERTREFLHAVLDRA